MWAVGCCPRLKTFSLSLLLPWSCLLTAQTLYGGSEECVIMMVGWFGSVDCPLFRVVRCLYFLSKSYSLHKSGVGKICERLESTRSDNLFTWYSHSGRRTDGQTKEHRHRRTDKHTVWSPDELCSSSKEVLNVVIVVVIANLIFSLKMSLTILDIKYFVVVWSFVLFLFRFFWESMHTVDPLYPHTPRPSMGILKALVMYVWFYVRMFMWRYE